MGTKFDDQLETVVRPLLEQGESLRGMCAGSWQKGMFSQSMVAFAVTDKRLILFGGFGGGESQRQGVEAVASFLA